MAKNNPTVESYKRVTEDLQRKIYKPIYLLMGSEPYFIDQVAQHIARDVLSEEEKAFNLMTLYGEECTPQQISETARRYPMMSNHQVVIVKEAQNVKKIEDLASYAQTPQTSTILVLCLKGKTVDKRKALYKHVLKSGEILESEPLPLYDTSVEDWAKHYLREKSCSIDERAAGILVEALGADLSKIANELDKLLVLLPADTRQITAEHIERNIGISKDYNAFELCSALMQKNVLKANRIIRYFESDPKNFNLTATLSAVFSQFTRLFSYQVLKIKYKTVQPPDVEVREVIGIHPYVAKKEYAPALSRFTLHKTMQILSFVRQADMRSKGWNNESIRPGDLLRELAFFVMH